MDESTATSAKPSASAKPSTARIPLGMSSFGEAERRQFGQSIRLAMACIEGTVEPVSKKAMPDSISDIGKRLKALAQDISSLNADLLELLVRYDELKGWQSSGSKHCTAWMNYELGISPQLAWEYLRVGKQLRLLPTTQALFRAGKLSWSKVRLITRVADADNEKTLCHSALDASVDEVQRLCCGYRWKDEQYQSQLHTDDLGMFDFEKAMRNDQNSFNTIIALSPTRFRFRVVDSQGRDIRNKSHEAEIHSTCVECNEPKAQYLIQMPPITIFDFEAAYTHRFF